MLPREPHREDLAPNKTPNSKVTDSRKRLAFAHLLVDDHIGSGKPIIGGLTAWGNQQARDVERDKDPYHGESQNDLL